ncbi:cupin domain-containing protein [Dermatophilaceae bacterium Sec6.4]
MSNADSYTISDNIKHFTIAAVAADNHDFRRVLWTGEHAQIVVMTIPPGGQIGNEVHPHTDQVLTFVSGTGEADLAGETHQIDQGDQCCVPAGTEHNFRNTGQQPLVLYTIYSPPEHSVDAVHPTKADADDAEETGGEPSRRPAPKLHNTRTALS